MAAMMGLATVELAADAVPRAVARDPVFKLGVRETGLSDEAEDLCWREGRSAVRLWLRMGVDGWTSVWICRALTPEPRGLG